MTLDAGCGNGAFSYRAARLGNRVIGIDFDPAKLRRCEEFRDVLGIPAERCSFRVHNIYDLESLGRQFDQIICFETLEHLQRDDEVLRQFARVLKPGGWLHLGTPRADRQPYYGETLSKIEDGGHVRLGYTHDQFEAMLAAHGLRVVLRDETVGWASRRLLDLIQWLSDKPLRGVGNSLRTAVSAVVFVLVYPITWIDLVVPSRGLCVYVLAQKSSLLGPQ